MKFIALLAIVCFFHCTLIAQQTFDPGYIFTQNKDTIKGFILVATESELAQTVKFKKEGSAEWKDFRPEDLKGFGMGTDVYKSMNFLNTAEDSVRVSAFLKQLVNGEYNLYSYVKPQRKYYVIQHDETNYFLFDMVSLNSGEVIQQANYYNYLNFVSISCEKVNALVKGVGYNDKAMSDFILKVDNCDSRVRATNLYQKPKTVILPLVFVGGLPFGGKDQQFTANFTLRFSLPKVDRKTSINIGINYSSTNKNKVYNEALDVPYDDYTLEKILSFPLTVQYNFTTSRVQPYFYLGFSGAFVNTKPAPNGYYTPPPDQYFGFALVCGIGIEARIVSGLFVKADWRYELILQYPAIGLLYHF